MALLDFVICICCSVIFGFLIGLERQLTGHTAGIRTNILVCLGACLFTLFSHLMDATDMTRIAAQVVTGIGFLCTGIIFKEGANVKGLNTAATIWCAAAIGVLCSSGMLYYATAAAAILIASNLLFRFIADRVHPLPQFEEGETTYILSVTCLDENEFGVRSSIMNRMKNTKLHLTNLESADEIGGKVEIEATVHAIGGKRNEDIENLTTQIALEKGVSKAGWELV